MFVALVRVELEQRPRGWRLRSDALLLAGLAIWIVAAYNARASSLIVAPASFLVLPALALPARAALLARAPHLRVLGGGVWVSYPLSRGHFPIVDWLERHT